MKKKLLVNLTGALALMMVVTACGQSGDAKENANGETQWPERSIQNVIPFGAGGGTDVWNRALMDVMGENLGQTIVSSNMTGGSAGSIGVDYVWKSKHDGYTLAGTSETPLTIPVQTGLEQTSKDWEYFIAAGSPGVLAVNSKSKYKSLSEIRAALEADPQSVSIAGTTGGLWFALAKLFESYADTPFKWIAYDGSGSAIKGAVSTEADCVVASAGELKEYVKSGDLIPLAIMDTEDWDFPGYGNVETVTKELPALEQYFPLNQFIGFKVPADTDPEILNKIQENFHKAMTSDKIKQFGEEQLSVLFDLSGKEANEMAKNIESKLCWVLYEMGQTKFSPEDFGIEKP